MSSSNRTKWPKYRRHRRHTASCFQKRSAVSIYDN